MTYSHPIFEDDQPITDGFVNIYRFDEESNHLSVGFVYRERKEAEKVAKSGRYSVYRIRIIPKEPRP